MFGLQAHIGATTEPCASRTPRLTLARRGRAKARCHTTRRQKKVQPLLSSSASSPTKTRSSDSDVNTKNGWWVPGVVV